MVGKSVVMACGAGLLVVGLAAAQAGDVPPRDGKPLVEIVATLENEQIGAITAIEFDDGFWEAEVHQDGRETDLTIDPQTGKITRRTPDTDIREELPPANGMPLSAILRTLTKQDVGVITEVEFDDGVWEVEVRQNGRERKLRLEPLTGKPR